MLKSESTLSLIKIISSVSRLYLIKQLMLICSNSVNVNGPVKISFADNIGLLESNQLNLMNGGHLTISSFQINSNIIANPRTSSSIERILFEDEMDLEIHWIKNEWPTIMINCEDMIKRPSNIRVILESRIWMKLSQIMNSTMISLFSSLI